MDRLIKQIVDLLKSIAELTIALVKFVPKLLNDFIMVINLVVDAVAQLPRLFIVFPSIISSLLIAVFAVVVVYKILGREG